MTPTYGTIKICDMTPTYGTMKIYGAMKMYDVTPARALHLYVTCLLLHVYGNENM